jgi:hypothetical protein
MPLRTVDVVEKDVVQVPTNPIAIADSKPTIVLPDITGDIGEYAGRYIQNVGANDCYYGIGHTTDPTNFNGILSKPGTVNADGFGSGQQFDASNFGQAVWVYSRGGTTIAVTILKRNDLSQTKGPSIGSFGPIK